MKNLILLLCVFLISACTTQLHHGLEEREANEIVSVLVARGFDVKKVPEKGKKPTFSIEIDESKISEALRVLNELKLPRAPRLKTQNIAQQQGLIDTPQAERLRQLEAQEGDVEEALETMDGVVSASVELVVPVAPRVGMPPTPSRASVLIRATTDSLDRLTANRAELKALVAGSVDGLSADSVVLVLDSVAQAPVAQIEQADSSGGIKVLAATLAVGFSLLAFALLFVVLKFQKLKRNPQAQLATSDIQIPRENAVPSAPVTRPIVSPNIQKKVA
jgi:type III secretion protein J